VTSENIERVRAIGGHMADLLTVLTAEFSTSTSPVRVMRSAAAVILQQVAGEDVMARPLADLTYFRC